MREFEGLVADFETLLLRSTEDIDQKHSQDDDIRNHASRLAVSELSTRYTRKQLRASLAAAESLAKLAEERLHSALETVDDHADSNLESIHNGYFRLYSTELFDMLGQPTNLRFGTLRFHGSRPAHPTACQQPESSWTALELALDSSFFVADSTETMPYHHFCIPGTPSLQNRGILSRKPQDGGAFPDYDSWLLFTFLGDGCLKMEVPIEMCADVYGGALVGRENEEVLFWGVFVEDEMIQ